MSENTLQLAQDSLGGHLSDPQFSQGIEQLVQPSTVFLQLARSIPVTRTDVNLQPQVLTGPTDMDWLGEGERKPLSDLSFSRQSLAVKNVAVIVPWTEELDVESFVGMRSVIQEAIADEGRVRVDADLWNGLPTTDEPNRPTGLLQQSGFLSHTFGSEADLGLDMKAMIRKLRVNNREPTQFAVHSTVLDSLQGIEDNDGRPKYPSTFGPTPSLFGIGLTISNNLPADGPDTDERYTSPIVLARWSDVWVGRQRGSVKLADQATLVKSDSSLIHLYQEDKLALRWVGRVSSPVVRRAESVCVMEDVVA